MRAFETQHVSNAKGNKKQQNKMQLIKQQMQTILDALNAGETLDLVGEVRDGSVSALLTLDTTFLNDPYMSNLVDAEFKVMGKVIRTVTDGDVPLNLARKSPLGRTP